MAHDEVLQDGLEIKRKPGEAPYMLLEDLQAERDVLDELAPRRVRIESAPASMSHLGAAR